MTTTMTMKPTVTRPEEFWNDFSSHMASRFVKLEPFTRAIALALVSGKNLLAWGPGAHAKSEGMQFALSLVRPDHEIFVKSFGEGLTEDRLFGGVNLKVLETEHLIRYNTDESFLAFPLAVFEEIFDAPSVVLLALKDTLTAKKLRNGRQVVPMLTEVLFGLTNKEPSEVADLGDSAKALLERFPIQTRVAWDTYQSQDYLSLHRKVRSWNGRPVEGSLAGALAAARELYKRVDMSAFDGILSELEAKAGESGSFVSPRSSIHAEGIVRAAAALRGSDRVEKQDLLDLRFLPGFENIAKDLAKELDAAISRAQAEKLLAEAEGELCTILADFGAADSPIKCLQIGKRLDGFADRASKLTVTDALTERRKKLRESAQSKAAEAIKKAQELTRI